MLNQSVKMLKTNENVLRSLFVSALQTLLASFALNIMEQNGVFVCVLYIYIFNMIEIVCANIYDQTLRIVSHLIGAYFFFSFSLIFSFCLVVDVAHFLLFILFLFFFYFCPFHSFSA